MPPVCMGAIAQPTEGFSSQPEEFYSRPEKSSLKSGSVQPEQYETSPKTPKGEDGGKPWKYDPLADFGFCEKATAGDSNSLLKNVNKFQVFFKVCRSLPYEVGLNAAC